MGIESDDDNSRNLRVKERKHYTEDCLQDEEIEGRRMFSVEEKLSCDRFEWCFVDEMKGEDFNLKYLQEHGFVKPVLFKDKAGLGMRMPSANFTVNDVRQCVGSRRTLDVMDVTTQKDIEMSMKDWCRYFENQNRDQLLNVISLEFSHTRLENYVESPTLVRQVDWVDWVWPRHLKESQTEGTNSLDEMKYPKVQKYCLMSVKGCYTDFHIDFGGTSVWYHILRGKKVFWLIPPTEKNLALYENWVLSGKQGDVFFGDTVEKCARVQLESGDTFFIPTGWIHAVYTPDDTLVFGGNFLHNFGIEKQLRIAEVEDITHVPVKFRYPFYTEILWYVVQRFVHCLLGKNYLIVNENGEYLDPANENASDALNLTSSTEKDPKLLSLTHNPVHMNNDKFAFPFKGIGDNFHQEVSNGKIEQSVPEINSEVKAVQPLDYTSTVEQKNVPKEHVHMTKWEYNGLQAILKWLNGLPPAKKGIPSYIRDPDGLLEDLRVLLKEHEFDDPRLAITGKPVLYWFDVKKPKPKPRSAPTNSGGGGSGGGGGGGTKSGKSGSKGNNSSNARRRRTRCKKCEACLRADCGECHFCKDMKKFGGPGRMKQSCISRQCMAPVLPHTACCMICGRDGWDKLTNPPENENSSLMECSQCWEILHPKCLQEKNPDLPMESCINDDLPNSWECPKCCRNGKPDQIKPRQLKGKSPKGMDVPRMMMPSNDSGMLDVSTNEMQEKVDVSQIKVEMPQNIAHPEMPDITKRMYDMEQPLDLGPLKKKVKVENMPSMDGCMEGTNNQDVEDMRNCLSFNNSSSIQSYNLKLPVKEEESSSQSPTSPNKDLYERKKSPVTPSHIRSCARYPLQLKKSIKSEQGKVLRVKNINENLKSKLPLGLPVKKHGETARERLFRNLKGLKKNLLIKKNFGKCEETNNIKPLTKDLKVIQSNGSIKIRQDMFSNAVEDGKHDLMSVTSDKLIKSENGELNGQNPKISSMLTNSPHLKKPKYVVRPAPVVEDNAEEKMRNSFGKIENLAIEKEVMLPVFQFLSIKDLYTCQFVCKTWNRWSVDPRLWTTMDLTRKKITASTLIGIVRRQPVVLNLSWTNLSRRQLAWLIARLPQMKELILSGCSSASVAALCTCNCPLLRSLDLSWVEGLSDSVIRDLLSPPPDSRPGFIESKTRLRHLTEVKLAGADISDVSVRLLAHHLPLLSKLDLSHCHKVTDMGIAVLGAAKSARLQSLDVSSCSNITDTSLEALKRCTNLSHLDLRDCGQVTEAGCLKFVGQNRQTLTQQEGKFIKRHV